MKKAHTPELEAKIHNLVFFRIHYQNVYKRQLENKQGKVMFALNAPTEKDLAIAKMILGWIFSNLVWEYLKKGISILIEKIRKNSTEDVEMIKDDALERHVQQIKDALKDFDALDEDLKDMIKEEASVHFMTDKIKEKSSTKTKTTFEKEFFIAYKESKVMTHIKFSSKEKVILRKEFEETLKETEN